MNTHRARRMPPLRQLLRDIASLPLVIVVVLIIGSSWQAGIPADSCSLPGWLDRLNLQDRDTIRALMGAVIGGVFTLTIFSYTMVMSVLNRAISNYTPRFLPLLLSQRYHQVMIGVAVGTIAHALIMLLVTQDAEYGSPGPPLLAGATAALLSLLSLGLFIHFIHSVSLSLHVNTLLRSSFDHTLTRIDAERTAYVGRILSGTEVPATPPAQAPVVYRAPQAGFLYKIDYDGLAELAQRYDGSLYIAPAPGSFVGAGEAVLYAASTGPETDFSRLITLSPEVATEVYATGFHHLVEVAVKACSPAINDPATALTALDYLRELFRYLDRHLPDFFGVTGPAGRVVLLEAWTPPRLFERCYPELERYLPDDPWTATALARFQATVESLR